MKNYILNTNIRFYASRLDKKDAHSALLGTQFKTVDSVNKSSKIDVQYEKQSDEIHIYSKPRCFIKNYVYDKNFIYVGVIDTDWTINEPDHDYIRKICKKHNVIPIFNGPGDFSTLISDILNADTFNYTHSKLNHSDLYKTYCQFNDKVKQALGNLKDTDVVWAQDYNFIHVVSQYSNSILTLPKFNELWKCIPFYNLLLDDILKVKVLDFYYSEDIEDFQKFVSYTYFPESRKLPHLLHTQKGIDKDFIDETHPKGTHCDKNTIVVPYDSLHHLICIDKFINKYDVPIHVYLLNISYNEISQEVLNYVNYLTLKTNIEVITPDSDEEFLNLASKCQIGFYKSLDNYFKYFNRHVIKSYVYDYENVADEIYKKLHYVEQKNELISDLKDDVANLIEKVRSKNEIDYKSKVEFLNISNITTDPFRKQIVLTGCDDDKIILDESNSSTLLEKPSTPDNCVFIKDLPINEVSAIILDYDGTLVPLCNKPDDAILSDANKEVLLELNKHIKVIISTGRTREDMDKFIPPDIEVFAEHCTFVRKNCEWSRFLPKNDFDLEYRIAKFYEERTPDSSLEKKSNGFVFHYRNSDPIFGILQAQKLYTDLIKISPNIKLGKKIIEYKVGTKKDIFKFYRNNLIICGDDVTDEDMFDTNRGITIRVGYSDKSKAEYYVKDVNDMIGLLKQLIRQFK